MVRHRPPIYLAFALASALFSFGPPASAADETFAPIAAIPIPGKALKSFDISFVDPLLGLYILGDRSNATVDVIDTGTNTVLTQLIKGNFAGAQSSNDVSGPNGVLIVRHREVWAGDAPCSTCTPATTDSTVKVIDLFNQSLTHLVHTGGSKRADEMCWDPRDHLVMVANNADNPPFASIIDTTTYSVVHTIVFGPGNANNAPVSGNGIEQCQWDFRTGKFYITVPGIAPSANAGGVAVIDPNTGNVINTFLLPVSQCDTPQGMAVGPDHQILIGCNGSSSATKSSVVIDDRNGHILATVPNESGPDEVWFNPGDDHYFLARSAAVTTDGTERLGVIDADSPGAKDDEQPGGDIKADADAVTTNTGHGNAHSVAADAVLNHVFVPIPGGDATGICGASAANGCIAVFAAPHDDRPEHDRMVDRDHR